MMSYFHRFPAYILLLCLSALIYGVSGAIADIAIPSHIRANTITKGNLRATAVERVSNTRRKSRELLLDETPKIINRSMGEKELLVIRIDGRDGASTTASTDQLIDDIFEDEVNVAKQFAACSHGKFLLKPAEGSNIRNGVATVELDSVIGLNATDVFQEIEALSTGHFGRALGEFDKVMICMPKGVLLNGQLEWIAFIPASQPYVNYMSLFDDEWCSSVSAGMHEIGHNLGLQHSGETNSYDDAVGQMGFSAFSEFGPLKCFNPAKSWQLGWYADRSLRFDPLQQNTPFSTILTGITKDFADGNSFKNILLQIPNGPSDFYIGYNHKDDFNSGTEEGRNKLLITEQPSGGLKESTLLAKLDAFESYRIENYRGKIGQTLVIAMKDLISYNEEALVNIYLEYDDSFLESPTGRNINTDDCSQNDRVRFETSVVTDRYPEETSWTLTNDNTGQIVASRSSFQDFTSHVDEICLERDGASYTFTFFDQYSDGICCQSGNGGYSAFLDGRELFRGGEFMNVPEIKHLFVVPKLVAPTLPPTFAPTPPPTPSPTIEATAAPSLVPTMVPTLPPTEVCSDDPDFLYKDIKTCQWLANVRDNEEELLKRCILPWKDKLVMQFCPVSCNVCKETPAEELALRSAIVLDPDILPQTKTDPNRGRCDDISTYLFENKPGKNCEWLGRIISSERRDKWCLKEDPVSNLTFKHYCPSVCQTPCRKRAERENGNENEKKNGKKNKKRKRRRKRKRETTKKINEYINDIDVRRRRM